VAGANEDLAIPIVVVVVIDLETSKIKGELAYATADFR
jgi:hypothetical protein